MIHKLPIPNRFLFRIEMECLYRKNLEKLEDLPQKYELPDFETLEHNQTQDAFSQKNNGKVFRVRTAWNEEGIAFQFLISGRTKELWCSANRPDESDRVELWLDTRSVHDVHRATRYCHRFVCLPQGMGTDGELPVVLPMPINRTKQMPNEIPNGAMRISSHVQRNSYSISLYLSANALTGFAPDEFQNLGITWALIDRDMPLKTLTAGPPFPFMEDPSIWYTLHLKREGEK